MVNRVDGEPTASGVETPWVDRLATTPDAAERNAFLDCHPELADCEHVRDLGRGLLRYARSDLKQAARLAEAGERLAEAAGDAVSRGLARKATAHVHFLRGDYEPALAAYLEALAHLESEGETVDVADVLSDTLQVRGFLGRYEDAFAAARRARAILEEAGDSLRLARLRSNHGNLLYRLDRVEEALELYRKSLAAIEAEPDATAQDVAAALSNVTVAHITLNHFEDAMRCYNALIAYCHEKGTPLLGIRAEYNIAYLHYLRGEYDRALELYALARERSATLGDRYHLALCDLDQAELYLELNLPQEAARLADAASKAFADLGMSYESSKALAFLALAEQQQGHPFRAVERFEQARERFAAEGNEVWLALIDLYTALIFLEEKRLFQARGLADRALVFFRDAGLVDKELLSALLVARIDHRAGDTESARERIEGLLARLDPRDAPMLAFQAWFSLGQVEETLADPQAAERAYTEAQGLLENLRTHLRGDQLKIAFLRDKLEVYEALVWLGLQGGSEPEAAAGVFRQIEMAKSRVLTEMILRRSRGVIGKSRSRSRLVRRMTRLREELNWYYRQLDREELAASSDPTPSAESGVAEEGTAASERMQQLRRESRRYEGELVEALGDLRSENVEMSSLQTGEPLELERIRAALPERTMIVEFYEARGVILAALLGRETLTVESITSSYQVREAQRMLTFQLSRFQLGDEFVSRFSETMLDSIQAHLKTLYSELIEPIAARLDADHLIIVPHGSLHYLPFHALMDGDEYWINRFSISYAPSASVYSLCAEKEPSSSDAALVMGIPDQLTPAIETEVRAVGGLVDKATVLVGPQASEAKLRELGTVAKLVHIATHGMFRVDNPMFCAIQLGDSRLTLFDLFQLELDAEIAVLSGCGTGLNVVESGDELLGLTRGLLFAGARSLLVSLWEVHDESTTRWMTRFYTHLESGKDIARAARAAMLEMAETHPHPYYWAPFVVVGDPRRALVPAPAAKRG